MSEVLDRFVTGLLSTTEQLQKRRRPYSAHLHPRDRHGRFARKPGSSMDVSLARADEANARGAVIGGPEGYFDALRRMVVDLGPDANPRIAALVADHAPQGIVGTHGAHRPAPALEVHPPKDELPDDPEVLADMLLDKIKENGGASKLDQVAVGNVLRLRAEIQRGAMAHDPLGIDKNYPPELQKKYDEYVSALKILLHSL